MECMCGVNKFHLSLYLSLSLSLSFSLALPLSFFYLGRKCQDIKKFCGSDEMFLHYYNRYEDTASDIIQQHGKFTCFTICQNSF